jgi:sugar phosphate isomerase/epimerase
MLQIMKAGMEIRRSRSSARPPNRGSENWVSRRAFLGAAAVTAGTALSATDRGVFNGVTLAVESYSFRDLPLEGCIDAMRTLGLVQCELFRGHVQPPKEKTETWANYGVRMREWIRTVPPDRFAAVRDKFRNAGIAVCGYDHSPGPDYADEEIHRAFKLAKILDPGYIMTSTHVSLAPRLDTFAEQYGVVVAYHNHSNLVADEPTRPEDLERAVKGNSHVRLVLDVGHFVAAGFDPVDFLEKNHSSIVALHIKDRKKNQGPVVPFGQGDTPIREVLRLVQRKKRPIMAIIEYEYAGKNPVDEVRRCLDYVKTALS